jgi:Na+/H+ antiporter NhaA
MDKKFAGAGLVLGILIGVIFDQLALGIIFGLLIGAGLGNAKAKQDGGDL